MLIDTQVVLIIISVALLKYYCSTYRLQHQQIDKETVELLESSTGLNPAPFLFMSLQ